MHITNEFQTSQSPGFLKIGAFLITRDLYEILTETKQNKKHTKKPRNELLLKTKVILISWTDNGQSTDIFQDKIYSNIIYKIYSPWLSAMEKHWTGRQKI